MTGSVITGTWIHRLGRNPLRVHTQGSVSVMFAVCLVPLIIAAAVAIDFARIAAGRANLQEAVDNAALSGAAAYTVDGTAAQTLATVMATSSFCNASATPWIPAGFTISGSGTTSCSGSGAGPAVTAQVLTNTRTVTVTAHATMTTLIPAYFGGTITISASGTAINPSGTRYCVLQLGSAGSVTINNGALANLVQCGLAINGSGTPALTVNGGAQLNTPSVSVVGSASVDYNAINPTNALKTGQPVLADPYAGVVMPPLAYSCSNSKDYEWNLLGWTLSPMKWCNGVKIGTNLIDLGTHVTLKPGVYFVDRGTMQIGGNSTITGSGVTIVLTSSTNANYGKVSIANGASVTLTAPTTGATAGIVFFGDRRATTSSSTSAFNGGSAMAITGAIYVPTQTLDWSNGAQTTPNCTQLIAGVITFDNDLDIEMQNCPPSIAAILGTAASTLVK